MQWFNKQAEGGIPFTGEQLQTTVSGIDLLNLSTAKGEAFLNITLRSVYDVTDDYEESDGKISHTLTANGEAIGTTSDEFCSGRGGLMRKFHLTLPVSFYFRNLTDAAMTHVTPNRLYQQNGGIIYTLSTKDGEKYLLFAAKNAILHTEGKQLMVTAQRGEGVWVFALGNSVEDLTAVYENFRNLFGA